MIANILSIIAFFSMMFGVAQTQPMTFPEASADVVEVQPEISSVDVIPAEPIAAPTKTNDTPVESAAPTKAPTKTKITVGDWVEYLYYDEWYQGQVTSISGDTCVVNDAGFNTGDPYFNQNRSCGDLRPYVHPGGMKQFAIGQKVEAKWEYAWYDATVVSRVGDRYTVRSMDGSDWEWDVPGFLMR